MALGLASFVQTTSPAVLDKIDEIIGAWLSALGETSESSSGEYVTKTSSDEGALPGFDIWQQLDQGHSNGIGTESAEHAPLSHLYTTDLGLAVYQNPSPSPTVSLSSFADLGLSFHSEASSSTSSLNTASTSNPPSPSFDLGNETFTHPLYEPGGHLAVLRSFEPSTIHTNHSCTPHLSPKTDYHHLDDDATPSLKQTSIFCNPSFVEFDPNAIFPTHAGRDDDDDDSTGYNHHDLYRNSASCYYNNDEHDEEADLAVGWGDSADGWGEASASAIPEDDRLKAVSCRNSQRYFVG